MNTIIEHDILHVGRVMRASVFKGASDITIVEYWNNRLFALFQTPHLTELQRHWVLGLMQELHEIGRPDAQDSRQLLGGHRKCPDCSNDDFPAPHPAIYR
jgi:hypothetical protein